jgi:hypothetical protein
MYARRAMKCATKSVGATVMMLNAAKSKTDMPRSMMQCYGMPAAAP